MFVTLVAVLSHVSQGSSDTCVIDSSKSMFLSKAA
jgi:hypothetical protein